jgi:transcriptional regulator with XRE-family HTH domain
MAINPKTLKLLLTGRNQVEVADDAGVDPKTISRILRGHQRRNNQATIKGIARALGTTPEVLESPPVDPARQEAEARRKAAGYRAVSARVSGHRATQYELVEARYRVSQRALIDAAPLLFTLLAEMSLAERRVRLEAFEGARGALKKNALTHLAGFERADDDLDAAHRSEEASIAASDIRGSKIDDDEWAGDDDLFVTFLEGLAENLAVGDLYGRTDWLYYNILEGDLDRITDGNPRAKFALKRGHASIRDIPAELQADDRSADRADWLSMKVPDAIWQEADYHPDYDF